MDLNRPEAPNNQQQNVHLHMHHVCTCQNNMFPNYYSNLAFHRPPSLATAVLPFSAPPVVPRPYLQHYQYTQFNMASGQYVPVAQVTSGTSLYSNHSSIGGASSVVDSYAVKANVRERDPEGDRLPEPLLGYDFGQVIPPANELLMTGSNEVASTENFVRFLERSCLTAEQIAYRNRNRPCFRNIQNLCIRTRSEILKPGTTISNIHSQGIPWATKDFIYAFVRLTNCWHILKGYWENRDGSSLGKIEKELTSEFRACYLRWEKETIDLAAHLSRVFYNLDTNLNMPPSEGSTSGGASVEVNCDGDSATANYPDNLLASQVNLKICSLVREPKSPPDSSLSSSATVVQSLPRILLSSNTSSATLPVPPSELAETSDQANQTCLSDFQTFREEAFASLNDNPRRVYMKPGSYFVPKKNANDAACNTHTGPRGIEFLETAQNVNKALDLVCDRYWSNFHISSKKVDLDKDSDTMDSELNQLNVHDWLSKNNFSENGEASSVDTSQTEFNSYFMDVSQALCDPVPELGPPPTKSFLQRPARNAMEVNKRVNKSPLKNHRENAFEMEGGGMTEAGVAVLEKMLLELKNHRLAVSCVLVNEKEDHGASTDLDDILKKVQTHCYAFVNEVVRDLRYLIDFMEFIPEPYCGVGIKRDVFEKILAEYFPDYDFDDIKGDLREPVGPLILKLT